MSDLRSKCDNRLRCGTNGHFVQADGTWVRCPCLEVEIHKRKLGQMFCPDPRRDTPLIKQLDVNLRIEGPLTVVRPHIAGAIIHLAEQHKTCVVMDAYRLIEIFLEKDEEFENTRPTIDADMLVILLGFGDPRNKYLPELLVQALNRRALEQKPTWVVMGVELSQVSHKYSSELQTMLANFQKMGSKT